MRTKWIILSGLLTIGIVSVGLGLIGVVLLVAISGQGIVGNKRVAVPSKVGVPSKEKQAVTMSKFPMVRSDFEALLRGKTKDEVKALIGPPSRTEKIDDINLVWSYQDCHLTKDPDNDRIDGQSNMTLNDFGTSSVENDNNWKLLQAGKKPSAPIAEIPSDGKNWRVISFGYYR